MVYQIPHQFGKVYAKETQRRLKTRVKEHRDACNKGDMWKCAISEYQWDQQHQVNWEETRMLDRAKGKGSLTHLKDPCQQLLDHDHEETRGWGWPHEH